MNVIAALITLAVSLPAFAQDILVGDVNGDGVVDTRDAELMEDVQGFPLPDKPTCCEIAPMLERKENDDGR